MTEEVSTLHPHPHRHTRHHRRHEVARKHAEAPILHHIHSAHSPSAGLASAHRVPTQPVKALPSDAEQIDLPMTRTSYTHSSTTLQTTHSPSPSLRTLAAADSRKRDDLVLEVGHNHFLAELVAAMVVACNMGRRDPAQGAGNELVEAWLAAVVAVQLASVMGTRSAEKATVRWTSPSKSP